MLGRNWLSDFDVVSFQSCTFNSPSSVGLLMDRPVLASSADEDEDEDEDEDDSSAFKIILNGEIWVLFEGLFHKTGENSPEESDEMDENEEDLLDRAWGLEPNSRLSCQAFVAQTDLVVEIPKYTINHAKELH